jgi:hypothetical protein
LINKSEARLEFRWLLAQSRVPMFLADSAFASTARLLEKGTQQRVAPLRVELTRRTQHTAVLRKHSGCEIVFNRPCDLLVFKSEVLDSPFRTHNAELLELMVPGLESALSKRDSGALPAAVSPPEVRD